MFRPLLISMFLTSAALADTWTVDDDGKADFDNIQAAVDAASDGDEIIVMPGTYTSTQDGHVVNMLGKAVTLRSSDPTDPDVVAATIIDGEDARRGLACFNDETSGTIIDGFTISNGFSANFDYNNNGSIGTNEVNSGGGIYLFESIPIIQNCIFENNNSPADYFGQGGGGIYINGGDGASIAGCIFKFNEGGYGGGIHLQSTNFVNISSCHFFGNTATITSGSDGGALRSDHSTSVIHNSIFTENNANGEGGALIYNNSTGTISGSYLSNNNAGGSGGGIYIVSSNSKITVLDSTVCSNLPDQINGEWTDGGGNNVADNCSTGPMGACCLGTSCTYGTAAACSTIGGTYQGDFVSCTTYPCKGDDDGDGILDDIDNCYLYNPDQTDCNGNDIGDVCDIADGTSTDWDGNEIPDDCECLADVNTDGNVNVNDILILIGNWGGSGIGDINQDGIVDVSDLLIVVGNWGPCE
jgi:hypothetical protein